MAWQTGEHVGPYEIVAQLGQGGMATVYKAHHARLDREVAIKVMHQTYQDDATFVSRFKREAQIVARLEHPHIVPVYDFNEINGQPYLVMKYVPGHTLKQRMMRAPLLLDEILTIMTAVASALTYAHSKGVLHRDVKPSNIVIDANNIPYLADFGLARITSAGESTLSADVLLGTPNYMSPEQAGGHKNLDGRTDIYSLGIVLYELLVGRVPFSADTPYAVIHDHIYTPLPAPSKINPDIPAEVEAVLMRATAKNPVVRYATADAMVDDLKEAIVSSKLATLNPDRSQVADVSLSAFRHELTGSTSLDESTKAVDVKVSYSPPMNKLATDESTKPVKRTRRWIYALTGVIAVVVLASAVVLFSTRATPAPVAAGGTLTTITANDDTPFDGLQIYPVPDISTDDADKVMQGAPNVIMDLAAAYAYWDNDPAKSYQAIIRGKTGDADPVVYLITAAAMAYDNDDDTAAAVYTLAALYEAEKTPDVYNEIRPLAGEYLYDTADNMMRANNNGLAQEIVGTMYPADTLKQIENSTPRAFLTARALLLNGNERLATAYINRRPAEEVAFRPEMALVRGEIEAASGQTAKALTLWQGIADAPAAPEWVKERAAELIKANA